MDSIATGQNATPALRNLTAKQIGFCRLTETAAEQRQEFYSAMYPGRAAVLADHWRWWYRIGADSSVEPLIALAGQRIVGQFCTIPLHFSMDGVLHSGVWCVDLGVLPAARSGRLGFRLIKLAGEKYTHLLAHGNDRSMGLGIRHCGWRQKTGVYRCLLPLRLEPLVCARSNNRALRLAVPLCEPSWRFALRALLARAPRLEPEALPPPETVARCLQPPHPEAELHIVRDSAWARWRFFEGPFRSAYRSFGLDGSLATVRPVVSQGLRRLHVVTLGGGDARARRNLLRGTVRWALDNGYDLVWLATDHPELLGLAKRMLPSLLPVTMAAYSRDAAAMNLLASGCDPILPCDSDFDLIYQPDPGAESW